jgi:hypothetical protein
MSADDRVLELLAMALTPESRQPPLAGVAHVRALAGARAEAIEVRTPLRPRRSRVVTWTAAAAVAAAAFLTGLAVADDMPRPVRGAAHAVGLPVDSNDLVDARASLDRLGRALAAGNADAVQVEDAVMVRLVKRLDDDERAQIEPVAHEVHLRAVEFLRDR